MQEHLSPSGETGIKSLLMVMTQPTNVISVKGLSMRARTVIKWMHSLLTMFLLILVVGFVYLNRTDDTRSEDELQHVYKINDCLWLYTTKNREGDATAPIIYRFYVSDEITGSDKEIIKKLNNGVPFLVGSGSISKISFVENDNLSVKYSGKVYSLSDTISYSIRGQQINAHISYHIISYHIN